MWWVDTQADRDVGAAFVLSRHAVRLILDLFTNHVEVSELLPLGVDKLRILCAMEQGQVKDWISEGETYTEQTMYAAHFNRTTLRDKRENFNKF